MTTQVPSGSALDVKSAVGAPQKKRRVRGKALMHGQPRMLGYAKGGWIKGAVKHPGRETERAKEHGVSVHQQLVADSHSKDKSLRAAGNLGLRFEHGIGKG